MKMKTNIVTLVLLSLAMGSTPLPAQETSSPPRSGVKPAASALPRLPAGVAELKFCDFFVTPVGPRGLEWTDNLRQLDGKKVRILGYMVQEEKQTPGVFILSPYPAQIHEHDNALADDLPPSVVHVISPSHGGQVVPHTPQLLLLTGKLQIGNRPEPGGRMSAVRLTIDRMSRAASPRHAAPAGKGAERLIARHDSTADSRPADDHSKIHSDVRDIHSQ